MKQYKNKIILFSNDLYIIDDVREEDELVLMSKLESNAEIEEFEFDLFEAIGFCFEEARLKAVDVMNQTRYFDNQLAKEYDNQVD